MSSHEPGSRAISIPVQPNSLRAATSRRSGNRKRSKGLERTDSSDAATGGGPSSSSSASNSSHASSWASSAAAATNAVAVPGVATSIRAQQKAPIRMIPVNQPCRQEDIRSRTARTHQGQQPVTPSTSPPPTRMSSTLPAAAAHIHNSPLGPSMMASSSYKSINLSSGHDDDEPPRLICYTKHSQGFTWNDELFLPGYLLGRYGGGSSHRRRRNRWGEDDEEDDDGDEDMDGMMDSNDPQRCPVAEIFVTDEEADAMMP